MPQNARITVRIRPTRTQVPLVLRGSDDQFLAVLEELTHSRGVLRARGWTVGDAAGLAANGTELQTPADQPRPDLLQGDSAAAERPDREACGFAISLPTSAQDAQVMINSRGRKHYFKVTV